MNTRPTSTQQLIRFGGPIVAVLMLYMVAFSMPLRRTLAELIAKQHKLEQVITRRAPEHRARLLRLTALQSEQRALDGEYQKSKQSGAHLVTRRADRKEQVFSTTLPAGLLAHTLELLRRHGLECLDSSPVVRAANAQGDSLETLKPVADLLGVMPGEVSGRRQVRLSLSGRFQDLQNAVREIQRELAGAFIVSLEMETADADASRPLWILTLSV